MNALQFFKKLLSLGLLVGILPAAFAQGTAVCNEKFSKTLTQGWTIQPAYTALDPSWRTEKGITVSESYAAHGYVRMNAGDTAELVTPFFNCQNYEYIILKFNHICKVLPSDICEVMYQEQGIGSYYQWKPLPASAYRGNCASYKNNLNFNHASYADWKANDTLATPTNSWWKEETFDLSNDASYSTIRFKFIIRTGNFPGSYVAAGWYVDDVQLLCSAHAIKPPVVLFTSNIGDTVYNTGPFVVNAKVATRTNGHIMQPYLNYITTYNNTTKHDSIKMKATAGDSMWTATIPQQYFGTSIQYYIIGRDSFNNTARANAGMYLKYPGGYDSNSVSMHSIDSPGPVSIPNPQVVRVTFKNRGNNNLKSAVLHWELNGVYMGSKNYSGNLPCDFNDTMTMGSYIHRVNDYDTVKVWIKLPNNVADKTVNDDTLTRVSLGCAKASSGSFAIGPNSQYKTLKEALNGIQSCGAGGDITLAFESGTYELDSVLRLNTAFMNGYHLTFTSKAQHRDSVILNYKASIAAPGMITLNNTENVTFSHLTIYNSSTSNSNTVCLNGPIDNVTFYHCVIKRTNGTGFATSGYQMTIGSTSLNATSAQANDNGNNGLDAFVRDLRFIGNHIDNGCRNVITMATTHRLHRLVFNDNTITDNTAAGLMVYRADSVTCNRNRVWVKDNTSSYWSPGIQLSVITGDSVCGNFVSFLNQGSTYGGTGISVSGTSGKQTGTGKSGRILIANNVILGYNNSSYVRNNAGSSSCLTISKAQADLYFNSVYNGRTSSAPSNANNNKTVYVLSINDTSDVHMVGNQLIAYDDKNQHTLNVAAATASVGRVVSEYNNFHFTNGGTKLAYYNGNAVTSLAALQPLVNDRGSVSINPGFVDPTQGLQLKDYSPFMVPNAGLTNDYEDSARLKITAIGAYRGKLLKTDASLVDFATTNLQGGQSCPVAVTLMNLGEDTLKSASIEWTMNNVAQKPLAWTGTLEAGQGAIVTLGSITPTTGSTYSIVAWVSKPNQNTDMNLTNDTTRMQVFVCAGSLNGTYTVGGAKPDFTDFDEAYTFLKNCGVSGSVTLAFRAGTYPGITIKDRISGTSDSVRITVTAENNATVTFDGKSEQGVLLSGTAHWVFKGVHIGNTSAASYGVKLEGGNTDILFRDCGIYASVTATKEEAAIYFKNSNGSSVYPKNVRFVHNTIQGGWANIYMYYMAGTNANMANASVSIDSNTLTDASAYGLYSYYYSHYPSITCNTVINRSGAEEFYALSLNTYQDIDTIRANRIRVSCTAAYGIQMSSYINASAKAGVLADNELIITGKKTAQSISLLNPYQNWSLLHNSVLATSDGDAIGLYLQTSKTKLTVMNNLLVTDGTSNYPVRIDKATIPTANLYDFDYNNYYSKNNIGYIGANAATLTDWQKLTGADKNSVSAMPAFTNSTSDLTLTDYSPFVCQLLTDAPTDIDGKARTAFTPMGCYSSPMTAELNLSAKCFTSPSEKPEVGCFPDFTDVTITVANSSRIQADFTASPLKIHVDVTGAATLSYDTTVAAGSLAPSQEAVFRLLRLATVTSGIYNLQVILTDTADHTAADDTLRMTYNATRVTPPFDTDFSTNVDEIVSISRNGEAEWSIAKGGTPAPVFGSGRLVFNGKGHSGDVAEAVLNAVNIYQASQPALHFWYAHTTGATKGDSLLVKVTANGGASYTVLGRIATVSSTAGWKEYSFDLTPFTSNRCISIVLQATSNGLDQAIDRLSISTYKDIRLLSLLPDPDQLSSCDLQNKNLKVIVENMTGSPITVANDTIRAFMGGAGSQQFAYVYNKQLQGYEKDTLTLSTHLNLSAEGRHTLNAWLQSADDNPDNDTVRDAAITIHQDVALTTVTGMDEQTVRQAGEQVQVTATVTNNGTVPVDRLLLRLHINGTEQFTDTLHRHIKAGDTANHTLSLAFTVPSASKADPTYAFELTAELSCDADNTNNSIRMTGKVEVPDTVDIQIAAVNAQTPATGNTKLNPSVRISNTGNVNAENIVLHVAVIDQNGAVSETLTENLSSLQAKETKDVSFTSSYTVPNYTGQYSLKAYVEAYANDADNSNDTLSASFDCTKDGTGIRDAEAMNWSMGQNIPNPAAQLTRIPYSLPQEGSVTFHVVSPDGKLIYRHTFRSGAGQQSIGLNTGDWADGVYYYSMEYLGKRIVKKMVVSR